MARTALFLSPGADLAPAVALARRADALGYESLWVTHGIGRDALLTLSAYAPVAPHAGLGTGVIPIYPRHPVLLAQDDFQRLMHVEAFPTVFVLDSQGRIVASMQGYTTTLGLVWRTLWAG